MAGHEDLRAAAARDRDFVGVDVDAMARLIQQMNGASQAISTWLRTNATLPPGVPRTGLREAQAVHTWTGGQQGMLTRRRNYALTHLNQGGPTMPKVSAGRLGSGTRRRTTSAGAGHDLGAFPDVRAATRAGTADAAAVLKAREAHRPVPDEVWKRLRASADDPDYTHGLYGRLGPAGTARLIEAAGKDHLKDVRTSLGVASHHLTMDEKWLRVMLDEALRRGVRDDAVALLSQAGLAHRTRVALGHLGLTEIVETGGSEAAGAENGRPVPSHEAMLAPAADDPHAAVELYSRHPETLHRALADGPRSEALARLVIQATTAHDADPTAVRANAERLAAFQAARSPETSA
ncbi:hypothetical protein [Actinoallomurus iriomotensis]|uniref:Uncharacterized protein n=1 Tax=Actinoallomurus iriomotensis TaxID=478107 RepID=A0A9W6RUH6_9ACTN|nr:hypothetical protein [Actinoallomurus iriomotensis]GLY82841.1 hypothetical protein Airi02_007710 [Actinoallomurus iriomotensis]